jgi:hypothetical protein
MLRLIKKFFSKVRKEKDGSARGGLKKKSGKDGESVWAKKQLGEMGKLGGKLILM